MEKKRKEFQGVLQGILNNHVPRCIATSKYMEGLFAVLSVQEHLTRDEVLYLAYLFGAKKDETNMLLETMGYRPLYVRCWEDAIWIHSLERRKDLNWMEQEIYG